MRALPGGWLQAYVAHQRYSESPESFHFWTGVFTLAGALRRKVWIDQAHFQYVPNFYIILVAPPGVVAKSTSIRQGASMLRKVKGVHFGPPSLTWQALIDSFRLSQEVHQIPGMTVPIASCSISIVVSELGTFMRPENREYLDHLTDWWDGQKQITGRKTLKDGEIKLENPWLNLIAATTPSWITDNFPKVLAGGGLASRILFIYANKKRQLIAYPKRLIVDHAQWKLEEDALQHDLEMIAKLAGEYHLTEEAFEWGTQWYHEHDKAISSGVHATSRMAGYLDRKQAHFHKLAMVLAASKRQELIIEKDDLIEAEAHISALEGTLPSVFNSIGVSSGAAALGELLDIIIAHRGEMTYRGLFKLTHKTMDGMTFKTNVMTAIENGLITREPIPGGDFKLKYVGGGNR